MRMHQDDQSTKVLDDKPMLFSQAELREMVHEVCKPLEAAAYAKGKRDGLAEAQGELRESTMVKVARLLPANDETKGKSSPADLARRARELQAAAEKEGKALSNIEAVQAAYREAGVPLAGGTGVATASTTLTDNATEGKPTAADLARRARELQAAAEKGGKALSNIEAVQLAYREAGVPLH